MSDREKIVRAVETCFDSWIDKHRNMGLDLDIVTQLKQDALELLKEQEPVEPVRFQPGTGNTMLKCGACLEDIKGVYNYCPWCGRRLKWK